MPSLREVLACLYGSWRLAHFDPGGLAYFPTGIAAATRSFWAAVLLAPAYALMVAMQPGDDAGQASLVPLLVVKIAAYVISWTAYPLLMDDMSRIFGCSGRYPIFLTAYNWSAILQMAVYLPTVALIQSGRLSPEMSDTVGIVSTVILTVYQWYVTRVALEVSNFTATGLVILDLVLEMFISGLADGML